MSSTASLVQFVTGQLGPEAAAKAMFGEYGIYLRGVLIALFCDDKLFLKPTSGAARLLGEPEMAPPYPGAKPAMLVPEESWEDRKLMSQLAEATFAELPPKAPKKKVAAIKEPTKAEARTPAPKASAKKVPAKAPAKQATKAPAKKTSAKPKAPAAKTTKAPAKPTAKAPAKKTTAKVPKSSAKTAPPKKSRS